MDMPRSRAKPVLRFLKKLLIAASVAIIIIGAVQTAVELLQPDKSSAPPVTNDRNGPPAATAPIRPMPTPQAAPPVPPEAAPDTTGQIDNPSSLFDPSTIGAPKVTPKLPRAEVTGSIPWPQASPRASAPATHPAGHSIADQLPAPIGPVLRAAVAASDPAAEYEVGTRYADGRGLSRNPEEAARWFERAANAGFAPAQFRLASLNEKGEGLKKDLQAARSLYLAAASKGHAKAMHNLAVLYAEGIDGKPDYKVAAQWFFKAASYGVGDSQYNLAILYARGIGVQTNLAESYKWFALAAAKGDPDASRKRDEVGARLDRQMLMAAKLAAQTFVPEPEPEEATNVKVPPGGWDRAPAATAKPRQRIPASAAR
jgi:localization factor PodJL